MMTRLAVSALAACLSLPLAVTSAQAAAPEPTKAAPAGFYAGRWYEIARLPNRNQKDCQGATSQFTGGTPTVGVGGAFDVVQTCHKGSPTGEAKLFKSKGKVDNAARNKFTMTFFGLVKQQYFVLDNGAADGGWAIMATPGGNFVWLLARKPRLDAATQEAAVARLKALGYPTDKLEYPPQAG